MIILRGVRTYKASCVGIGAVRFRPSSAAASEERACSDGADITRTQWGCRAANASLYCMNCSSITDTCAGRGVP